MLRSVSAALALGFLALTGVVHAADRPPIPEFDVADRLMPDDPMPERPTAWSNTAVTLTDVVYATIPGFRALHLDLYRPVRANGPLPVVVFLHGGAWAFANPRAGAAFRNLPVILSHLAETGYVVAAVEYRFSGEASFPAPVEDVQAAIRFLRTNGARFGLDGTRIGLWGMSAGAYLAAMAAMNCAEGSCVQGWVGWFGIYDFTSETAPDADLRHLLGCGPDSCTRDVLERVSPIRYADRQDPPVLLVHGTADEPFVSQQLAERLRAVGATVDVLLIPQASHGFIGPTEAATKENLRQALAATFTFFDRVLPPVRSSSSTAQGP
jgi:acetyl esterase/lipase